MYTRKTIFIRSEDRPDLRAAMDAVEGLQSSTTDQNCFTTFPRSYRFSGCNEKHDKADKTKEVGKDDKSNRAPVKDRASRILAGTDPGSHPTESLYQTIFS